MFARLTFWSAEDLKLAFPPLSFLLFFVVGIRIFFLLSTRVLLVVSYLEL